MQSLSFKLPAALVFLFSLIGITMVVLTRYSSDRYYQEVTQRLNAPVAMYVTGEAPLIRNGAINTLALASLAHQAMIVNPSVEVYLLDTQGRVLGHGLGSAAEVSSVVDLEPVRLFLQGTSELPLHGDDPRRPEKQKIFAAAEVVSDSVLEGYVYIILGGEKYERLTSSSGAIEVLRLSTLAVIGCLVFGLASALLIFARLSRRLKMLTDRVNVFCIQSIGSKATVSATPGDELVQLSRAFDAMQARIDEQLAQIRDMDKTRRELVAHVSHDLRTPLTTMRGYIETLALKHDSVTPGQRRQYLNVAHQHALRLGRLIDDLFELARLDAGVAGPQQDAFCAAELIADVAQEFCLEAKRRGVNLKIVRLTKNSAVWADIRLIERVFTNLIDNALRHTPSGGEIALVVSRHVDGVQVSVIDNGIGIAEDVLPKVFERGFRVVPSGARQGASSGLGLAIVKRILQLHGSNVSVHSRPGKGAVFRFVLKRFEDDAPALTRQAGVVGEVHTRTTGT